MFIRKKFLASVVLYGFIYCQTPSLAQEKQEKKMDSIFVSHHRSYLKRLPSSSLRLNEPLMEISQNIQVVTGSALRDQQAFSMSDAVVRNVSGLMRVGHWGDLYTQIYSRGSRVQAFRNGFNVVNSYWGPLTEDMSCVDRIEFVKGPSSFMLANGDPAGIYNAVTKQPSGSAQREISFHLGSFNLYRLSLDADGKLSKDGKLLYRINLAAQNKGSHRDNEFTNRYTIAPVISYQINDELKISLEYIYQRADLSNIGSFYVFSRKAFGVYPRNLTMLPSGMPATHIDDHSFFGTIEYQVNKSWKITGKLSHFIYLQDGFSMWIRSISDNDKIRRYVSAWQAKSLMSMGQFFINGDIYTGAIRHRILAGVEMTNKQYFADWNQTRDLDSIGKEFDPNAPRYTINKYPPFDYSTPIEERATAINGLIHQRYESFYIQDELGFFNNKLRLTLAGRYTFTQQIEYGAPRSAQRFTPRVGLSFSPDTSISIYALYDESFIPQSGRLSSGGEVKPLTGQTVEVGIKKNWLDGKWNSTLSVYYLLKRNELISDPSKPAVDGFSIVLGEKRARGVEFDVRGEIAKDLSLIANYAYTDSRISEVAEGVTQYKEGDVVPTYPTHIINGWLTYTLPIEALKNVGISAGATYMTGRESYFNSTPGLQKLPTYLRVDGGIFWEKKAIKVILNVFNLLDAYLYDGGYTDWGGLNAYWWQTEPGRNFRLSINYKF